MLGTNIAAGLSAGCGTDLGDTGAAIQTPQQIFGSALVFDFDPDVGVTTVSGNISAWADQSGRGNNGVQNTAGLRLPLIANALDGHAIARGVGADDYISGSVTGLAAGAKPHTWLVIAETGAAGTNPSIILDTSDNGSTSRGLQVYYNTDRRIRYLNCTAAGPAGVNASDEPPYGYRVMHGGYVGSSSSEVVRSYVNEALRSDATLSGGSAGGLANAQTTFQLGSMYGVGGAFSVYADLARLITINRPATVSELNRMALYLGDRYPSSGILTGGYILLTGQSNASNIEAGSEVTEVTGFTWGQYAESGTSISQWQAGTALNDRLLEGLTRIRSSQPIAIAWIQGESDATGASPTPYVNAFTQLQDDIAAATGRNDIFWVDVQLHASCTSGTPTGRTNLRTAKTTLEGLGRTTLLNCDDVTLSDGVHWDTAGRNTMTARIAAAVDAHF